MHFVISESDAIGFAAIIIALVTLFVANGTLKVAKDTLAKIDTQITLAADTLQKVDTQIELARQELDIVKVDLAQSTEAFNKSNRQSKLWLFGQLIKTNSYPGANSYELRISIKNEGTIPDLRNKVIIGFHNSFNFDAVRSVPWSYISPFNRGCFKNFTFCRIGQNTPIYPNDSEDLPVISVTQNKALEGDLNKFIIIGRVLSDYERNPGEQGKYMKLIPTFFGASSAEMVNVFEDKGGLQVGPFDA